MMHIYSVSLHAYICITMYIYLMLVLSNCEHLCIDMLSLVDLGCLFTDAENEHPRLFLCLVIPLMVFYTFIFYSCDLSTECLCLP